MKEILPTEEMICRDFWKSVESMISKGIIHRGDVFCISNNQRGGKKDSGFRQHLDNLLGVTKGVADYCVLGIGYLEAKRVDRVNKNGTVHVTEQSPEQIDFELRCKAKGQKYAVFYSAREGIDILREWLECEKQNHTVKSGFTPASDYLKKIVVRPV
jgi:hypothetical protein